MAATLASVYPFGLAQAGGSDALNSQLQSMLNSPEDPGVTFDYATRAIANGNLNAAISAFERMLKINPDLDNIRLELGVLYLQVGANDLASKYIGDALQAPDIPSAVKNRANTLYQVARDTASPDDFSFRIGLGSHYDDNATAAPDARTVLVAGFPALLDEEDTGRSDTAYSVSLTGSHRYTFNHQSGSYWVSNLSAYTKHYDEATEIDLDYLSLSTGPQLFLGPLLRPNWLLNPFIAATAVSLDGEDYQDALDLGLKTQRYIGDTVTLGSAVRYSKQHFNDSETRTGASDRSGGGFAINVDLSKIFANKVRAYVDVGGGVRNAQQAFEARDTVSVALGAQKSFALPQPRLDAGLGSGWLPRELMPRRWSTDVSLGFDDIDYDAPDPSIQPDTRRQDERTQVRWRNTFTFSKSVFASVEFSYTDNTSSLPNYTYSNTGGALTLWFSL